MNISDDIIKKALDPEEFIRRKTLVGGSAPVEVRRMLTDRKKKIVKEKERLEDLKKKVGQSLKSLYEAVNNIM